MTKRWIALITPILIWLPVTSHADMIDTEGMAPWEVCAMCHGLDGVSAMSKFPKLAGQHAPYIEQQIRDFQQGMRTNDGGQMQSIVSELSEDEITQVANWFSSQAHPTPPIDKPTERMAEQLHQVMGEPPEQACGQCHKAGEDPLPAKASSQSQPSLVPYLHAQHPEYLAKQLRDFVSGDRVDPGENHQIIQRLDETAINLLARYFAGISRTGP